MYFANLWLDFLVFKKKERRDKSKHMDTHHSFSLSLTPSLERSSIH